MTQATGRGFSRGKHQSCATPGVRTFCWPRAW